MEKTKKFAVSSLKAITLPVIVYLIFKIIRPATFGSPEALYIIAQQAMMVTIMSLGMCCNMTIGIWDFSPGSIVTVVGLICGHAYGEYGFAGMVIAGILSGMLIGLLNATVYTVLKVPSVVVTVGMLLIYESFGSVYKGGLGVTIDREGAILGQAPWIFLITALMFVILYVIYNKTKIGFNVKAVGNNELIAKTAGINPRQVKFLAFFIAGCFFGIAGLINLSYGTALSPAKNMGTMSVTFDAMMAGFIAIYLSGVVNRVVGIVIGTFTMKLVSAGLVAIGVEGTWQKVIIGVFLLFFIGFTQIKAQVSEWLGRIKRAKKTAAG